MECCEKKFLYEVSNPGVIYLTLDDHKPVYVGFQQKIKLEICIVHDDGQDSFDPYNTVPRACKDVHSFGSIEEEAFTKEEFVPAEENKLQASEDENLGRGKRKKKKTLVNDTRREMNVIKRPKRESERKKAQKEAILAKEKEDALEQRKKKLLGMKTFRVSDVGWKTASWKLAKMRASRAARKRAKQASSQADIGDIKPIQDQEEIVSCKFCFKAFSTKQELYDHHKIINPPTHLCEICDAGFPFRAHLLVHMKYHNKNKTDIYRCDECGLDTKNSTGMKRHMIKHTNEKCYKCCICGKESFDFGTSKMHLLTHIKNKERKIVDKDTDSGVQGLGLQVVKQQGEDLKYTCTFCTQTFSSKNDFFNHARILNPLGYRCEICGVKFAFQAFLLVHMKNHREDKDSGKLFVCDECGLDAKTPTRLKRHMLTHTNEKCYKCCVCGKQSPHYGTAKLHLLTHEKKISTPAGPEVKNEHSSGLMSIPGSSEALTLISGISEAFAQSFTCDLCNQAFNTKKELINHHKIFNPLTHICDVCGSAFPYRAYLLVHMKTHGKDKLNGTLYKCDECGLNAKNTTRLKRHMITHTKEQCYKCCICPKTSSCFSTAQKHFMFHRRNGMLKCTCCNTHFPNRQALASHQLAVMEIKCELCGQEFPNRTSRTLHLKSDHPQQILRCHLCVRVYTNQAEFANHMAYHENNKKKQCPVCGKFVSRMDKHLLSHRTLQEMDESELWMCHKCPMKFKLKSSFIRHLASHSEERNFHCHLCPKAFTSGSELGRHLRRHSSLTPYQCQECGKWFRERRNLKSHMQVHSDAKAFQCSLCSQGFNHKSSLDGHMRTKHALGTEPIHFPIAEPQVMMPHPQPASMPHPQMPVDHLASPVVHSTPVVQFTVVSNWPGYNT
ncbi:Zinc finger protein 845 [Plakobranchus ocellatus]|uniref:Zinc finger protein 845 n=1 Tax=Plakobranchus ocellatus TaxID=259542 RepID=A0AAV4AYX8_9GAST|nr:Zinc finger protein 845 [Plakobranchus ocellatus]